MDNYIKSRDWLKLALLELDAFFSVYEQKKFYLAVYHLQQSVEKACKAIISFLGIEIKYTHFPANEIIKKEIIDNVKEVKRLSLNNSDISHLKTIIESAIPLEREKAKPRYGEETEDRIILPTEIYTEEKANTLIENGYIFWQTVKEFFSKFPGEELKDVLNEIDSYVKKLR